MTDKALVSVIATVIHQHRLDGFTSRELAHAILDKAEPLIRADERERIKQPLAEALAKTKADLEYVLSAEEVIRADERADLRAKVEALRYTESGGYGNAINDVLALFDGSSDD